MEGFQSTAINFNFLTGAVSGGRIFFGVAAGTFARGLAGRKHCLKFPCPTTFGGRRGDKMMTMIVGLLNSVAVAARWPLRPRCQH
jgi:hypothetical protein